VLQQLYDNRVFQHVCVVACMKGVSVTEHGKMSERDENERGLSQTDDEST
jgi:hypothetical protein